MGFHTIVLFCATRSRSMVNRRTNRSVSQLACASLAVRPIGSDCRSTAAPSRFVGAEHCFGDAGQRFAGAGQCFDDAGHRFVGAQRVVRVRSRVSARQRGRRTRRCGVFFVDCVISHERRAVFRDQTAAGTRLGGVFCVAYALSQRRRAVVRGRSRSELSPGWPYATADRRRRVVAVRFCVEDENVRRRRRTKIFGFSARRRSPSVNAFRWYSVLAARDIAASSSTSAGIRCNPTSSARVVCRTDRLWCSPSHLCNCLKRRISRRIPGANDSANRN